MTYFDFVFVFQRFNFVFDFQRFIYLIFSLRVFLFFFYVVLGLNYIYESRQKTMRGCFIFSIRVFFSWFAIDNFHLCKFCKLL